MADKVPVRSKNAPGWQIRHMYSSNEEGIQLATSARVRRRLGRTVLANVAGRESVLTLKPSSYDSPARTLAGATTGSWVRGLISDTIFRTRLLSMFFGGTG
jgi:hypothetical protein